MSLKLIHEGAEAKIYVLEDQYILKERIPKKYRINELDERLRKHRNKAEAKILRKCYSTGINVPELIKEDRFYLKMKKIEGKKIKEVEYKSFLDLIPSIVKQITLMHRNDIIHGDLTTSNIIYDRNNKKIYIIDFGLSFISKRIEDKAVDLKVFFETIVLQEKNKYELKKQFLKEYLYSYKEAKKVVEHLKEIERRGRYK